MREKRKIGWQKYESVIEEQMSSPFLNEVLSHMSPEDNPYDDPEEEAEYQQILQELNNDEEVGFAESTTPVALSEQMLNELSILTSFDCWVGYTNFNITARVKTKLDKVEGVEMLKICSRYRFFIGIGKMFDFKTVRANLEQELL